MKLCGSHFLAVRAGPECEVTGVPVVFVQFKLVTACSQDAACNCWRGGRGEEEAERELGSRLGRGSRGGAPGARRAGRTAQPLHPVRSAPRAAELCPLQC